MAEWNPHQQFKFTDERIQPAVNLASRIQLQKKPQKILDKDVATVIAHLFLLKNFLMPALLALIILKILFRLPK